MFALYNFQNSLSVIKLQIFSIVLVLFEGCTYISLKEQKEITAVPIYLAASYTFLNKARTV